MRRQTPYADSNSNPYAAAQMQHTAAQRMQHNVGKNNFSGRPDSFSTEEGHPYIPSHAEGQLQWQWDRDGPKVSNPMSSHLHGAVGLGGNAARSLYPGRLSDTKVNSERQTSKEPEPQSQEQDMEIGYEDKPAALSFEGLEQKFMDEIMKFVKEQSDAEDAENARHMERMIEINKQYQQKLSSLRVHQASRREEFFCEESQARKQFQQGGHMMTKVAYGYSNVAAIEAQTGIRNVAAMEAQTAPSPAQLHPPPFHEGGRNQGTDTRVPYPEGRVYNNMGAPRYY